MKHNRRLRAEYSEIFSQFKFPSIMYMFIVHAQ